MLWEICAPSTWNICVLASESSCTIAKYGIFFEKWLIYRHLFKIGVMIDENKSWNLVGVYLGVSRAQKRKMCFRRLGGALPADEWCRGSPSPKSVMGTESRSTYEHVKCAKLVLKPAISVFFKIYLKNWFLIPTIFSMRCIAVSLWQLFTYFLFCRGRGYSWSCMP